MKKSRKPPFERSKKGREAIEHTSGEITLKTSVCELPVPSAGGSPPSTPSSNQELIAESIGPGILKRLSEKVAKNLATAPNNIASSGALVMRRIQR